MIEETVLDLDQGHGSQCEAPWELRMLRRTWKQELWTAKVGNGRGTSESAMIRLARLLEILVLVSEIPHIWSISYLEQFHELLVLVLWFLEVFLISDGAWLGGIWGIGQYHLLCVPWLAFLLTMYFRVIMAARPYQGLLSARVRNGLRGIARSFM